MRYITYGEFYDKILNELGYGIDTEQCRDGTGTIYITERGTDNTLASIDNFRQYTYEFTHLFFTLSEQERWDLYVLVILFTGTPYRVRFPQKKYKYKLDMIDEKRSYISIFKNGNLVLVSETDSDLYNISFTDSEIEKMSESRRKLFSIAVKEEVE